MEPNKVISSYKDIISILDRKLLSKAIERLKTLADELSVGRHKTRPQ